MHTFISRLMLTFVVCSICQEADNHVQQVNGEDHQSPLVILRCSTRLFPWQPSYILGIVQGASMSEPYNASHLSVILTILLVYWPTVIILPTCYVHISAGNLKQLGFSI